MTNLPQDSIGNQTAHQQLTTNQLSRSNAFKGNSKGLHRLSSCTLASFSSLSLICINIFFLSKSGLFSLFFAVLIVVRIIKSKPQPLLQLWEYLISQLLESYLLKASLFIYKGERLAGGIVDIIDFLNNQIALPFHSKFRPHDMHCEAH